MKRFFAAIMAVALMLHLSPPTTVFALTARESTETVAEMRGNLEKKYDITIQYPSDTNGYAVITPNSLTTLDNALETVTPSIVRQVSGYYSNKNNTKLTFRYVPTKDGLNANNREVVLAGFDPDSSIIELYIPTSSENIVTTGENPITIVHEFGHAFHLMVCDKYGYDKMLREWSSFNGGLRYNTRHMKASPEQSVFITGYAATMFEEDVAETFSHAFIRYNSGQGFSRFLSSDGKQTGLGKKVAYLESMIARYFKDSDQALKNFRRVYNTSAFTSYQGMRFSGEYLQFSGYPQPRFILKGTLGALRKEMETAVWIRSIGGWYVRETNGNQIIVFPGGVWIETSSNFTAPKVKSAA